MAITSALRKLLAPWAFAALLPLPILLATDPAKSVEIKCVYLGLASALLATEVFPAGGTCLVRSEWQAKLMTLLIALGVNASLFAVLGLSISVQSNFPFICMAALSVVPAVGLAPWLSQHVKSRYSAIILGAMMVAGAKLMACVVARVVYGPEYIEAGYVAGDWRTAKLMIGLFWTFTVTMSIGLLLMSYLTTATENR